MLRLAVICLTGLHTAHSFDPYSDGPYATGHKSLYPGLWGDTLDTLVDVYYPITENPLETPVLFFVSGLGGILPGFAYQSLHHRIASHGITVMQPFSTPSENTYEGVWMDNMMNWLEEHIMDKIGDSSPGLQINHRTKFIMGHSAGGHVVTGYVKHHCSDIKGVILFSPVDGFDPFGLVDLYAVTPGEYLNFAVPTLMMVAGLDEVPGKNFLGDLMPPCAPQNLSNTRFYDALPADTWMLNATLFGHVDALEEFFVGSVQVTHFCAAGEVTQEERSVYRDFVSGETIAFISHSLGMHDCDALKFLEDPSLMPVDVVVTKKGSTVDEHLTCGEPYCIWQEEPFPQF